MYLSKYIAPSVSRGFGFSEDRISGLPDDIILTFLDPMEMKEAAKTSILSQRWRYLWAKRTHLDFDPDHVDLHFYDSAHKGKYINWVNQVVGLHCNPCIDTFKICFGFNSSDTHHFERWVKFALSRKVKNLELAAHSPGDAAYTLGFDILKPSGSIEDSDITSLTSLSLIGVDISGDFVEFLFSKCRHLERLHVEDAPLLVRLKVIGLSLKLKHLTICDCSALEELEIDDVNLTYFNFSSWGGSTNLVLKNMPMLVEATFRGACVVSPVSIFQQISHLAAHLCNLTIDINKDDEFPARAFPVFCNLKHLNVVTNRTMYDIDVICRLLEACPMLHEFKLENTWGSISPLREADLLVEADMLNSNGAVLGLDYRLQFKEQNTHPNLTLLEVVGYIGCNYDIRIIFVTIGHACNLETIICNSCNFIGDVAETSRARANKLKKLIPKICVIII